MAAGKPRRLARPTTRQCLFLGSGFFALGMLQLLLAAIVGGHVLSLVVGIGWLVIALLNFASAAVQIRREKLHKATDSRDD
ncbi:MAG TPA: hypothetical protein VNF75_09515 [Candidatus Dormibacteraeota bacterium]|nr:hypothetical protein [Candidatus Dormibacteraeota bacterium]